MSAFEASDPFADAPEADAYVPRRAAELALTQIEDSVEGGTAVVAMHGPDGIGKSLLLRVLETRLHEPDHALLLEAAPVGPDEITAWILSLLDESRRDGETANQALRRIAAEMHEDDARLLILVDDADSIRLDTLTRLGELAHESAPGLGLVVALRDDENGEAPADRLAALGADAALVPFAEAMDRIETNSYLRVRMVRAGIPIEARSRLDRHALDWIAEDTEGIPRRVNRRASEWLESLEAASQGGFDESLPRAPISEVPTSPTGLGGGLMGRGAPPLPLPAPPEPSPLTSGARSGAAASLATAAAARARDTAAEEPRKSETEVATGLTLAPPLPDATTTHPLGTPDLSGDFDELPDSMRQRQAERGSWGRRLSWVALLIAFGMLMFALRQALEEPTDLPPQQPPLVARPAPPMPPEPSPEPVLPEPAPTPEPEPTTVAVAVPTPTPSTTPRPTPRPTPTPPRSGPRPPRPAPTPTTPSKPPTFVLIDEMGTNAAASSYIRVTIDAAPGDRIEVDGETVGTAPLPDLLVAPGVHIFTAHSESGFSVEQVVEVGRRTRRVEF